MSHDKHILSIHLLDRLLQIKTPTEKAEDLQKAAQYVNTKMREVKESGSATGNERIAMMAALNIAFELMNTRKQKDIYLDSISSRIRDLQNKIDSALAPENQELEI